MSKNRIRPFIPAFVMMLAAVLMGMFPSPASATTPGPTVLGAVINNFTTAKASLVSSPLSTTAGNQLVVVTVSADGPAYVAGPTANPQRVVSFTGCGLTWSSRQVNGEAGVVGVASATTNSALNSCKVTVKLAQAAQAQVTVTSYADAELGTADGYFGYPASGSARVYKDGTIIGLVGHDWYRAFTPELDSLSTFSALYRTSAGDTNWVQTTQGLPASDEWYRVGADTGDDPCNWTLYTVQPL